jgi:hypothetical protein
MAPLRPQHSVLRSKHWLVEAASLAASVGTVLAAAMLARPSRWSWG